MKTVNKRGLEIYNRINTHLLHSDSPSVYLRSLPDNQDFAQYPFSLLLRLCQTEQSPVHHPEGNVWEHTMLVVDNAARLKKDSRKPEVFMWAALLHDIGKPQTTKKNGRRTVSYDHDRIGAELARGFLLEFMDDIVFAEAVSALVRYHMHVLYVLHGLPYKDLAGLNRQTDIREVALLGLCDRLGRSGADEEEEKRQIRLFLERCEKNHMQGTDRHKN